MEKLTKRKLQAIESRKHILDTALELTKKYGFERASIQDICREAGVSTGAFYHYFKSKDEIVLGWFDWCDRFFKNEVIPQIKGDSSCEKVLAYISNMARYAEDTGVEYITVVYRAQLQVDNEIFLHGKRAVPDGLAALIAEGQESGEFRRDIGAREMTDEILIVFRGTVLNWCWSKGAYSLSDNALRLVARYMAAFMEKDCSAGSSLAFANVRLKEG